LFKEDFAGLETEAADLRLKELDVLAPIFQQLVDDLVDVHLLSRVHARWKNDNLNNRKIKYGRVTNILRPALFHSGSAGFWITQLKGRKN
jgi:hypothetical protein